MSFSTPPHHSVPQWFLVQRTNRNYAPYIPPSPFSSDLTLNPWPQDSEDEGPISTDGAPVVDKAINLVIEAWYDAYEQLEVPEDEPVDLTMEVKWVCPLKF